MKYNLALLIVVLFTVFLSCNPAERDGNSVKNLSSQHLLDSGWQVQNTSLLKKNAGELSSAKKTEGEQWFEATVPSTVMGVLTANKVYTNLFMGDNIKQIDSTQFNTPWIYRKEFKTPALEENQHAFLNFDGISYYANIWLNGTQIASKDTLFGAFRRFRFDITPLAKEDNILVVELFRQVAGDFGIGFVDWNPRPADGSMGIWRPVTLEINGEVSLENTYVETKVNLETLDEAWLTIQTKLSNLSNKPVNGVLLGKIGEVEFTYNVNLEANETQNVSITKDDIPALHFRNPKLWWSNGLGEPNLYNLALEFSTDNTVSDTEKVTFGIREVADYYTKEGYRGYMLNGRKVLIKGGGWTDDIFLRDTPESNETQVKYTKDMNLNTIRFENIWGTSQNIYDLCDKYGILAMVGWTCHWEWDEYTGKKCDGDFGCILTDQEVELMATSLEDQILWLRNHPSIFVWFVGSDKLPLPKLEKRYKKIIDKLDGRPYLASAGGFESSISGPTGVKMSGPYDYVGPNYWYIDTDGGGAYGFNTETGPGPQIPVLESIKRMIPEENLWPINKAWDYKCTHSKFKFNKIDLYVEAQDAKFGKSDNLEQFLRKSAATQYEAMRGMFEAFRTNRAKATGVIQWMLNSAWPSLYWQLYDYYLLPTPAYYAAKKSNQPVQLMYNYKNGNVYVVNETLEDIKGYQANIQLFNIDSNPLLNKEVNFDCKNNTSKQIFELAKIKGVQFLNLMLKNAEGQVISSNFYWLSEKQDEYKWETASWWGLNMKGYADFTALNKLQPASVETSLSTNNTEESVIFKVTLKNTSDKIAFFIDAQLRQENGTTLFPVFWDDNYVSLLPGETRTLTCKADKKLINNQNISIDIKGWNIEKSGIKANPATQ